MLGFFLEQSDTIVSNFFYLFSCLTSKSIVKNLYAIDKTNSQTRPESSIVMKRVMSGPKYPLVSFAVLLSQELDGFDQIFSFALFTYPKQYSATLENFL